MNLGKIKTENGESLETVSSGNHLSTFAKLMGSLEANTFIVKVHEDSDVLNLLSGYHKSLSPFEHFIIPLLFSINRQKKAKEDLPWDKVDTEEENRTHVSSENMIRQAIPAIDGFFEKFNEKYKKILAANELQPDSMTYQEQEKQQILGMIISQVLASELGDEEKAKKSIRIFEGFLTDDPVLLISKFLDPLKKEIIDFGMNNRAKMIANSGLDENKYKNVVEKLENDYEVIKPLFSIFFCENEKHKLYSFYMLNHSIVPQIKCPICNRNLSAGTFYYFIPQVNDILKTSEGLLGALTIFKMAQSGRKWLSNVSLKDIPVDTEKDIVIETDSGKYTIIEIKNFAFDVDMKTRKDNVSEFLDKALRDLLVYEKQGIALENIYLISNLFKDYENVQVVIDLCSKMKYARLNNINLKTIGPNNIHNLDELKINDTEKKVVV